jgi:dTDP-L-rhamnose 4-epimerase
MKKILVTGGCGFIGKVLCLRLVESGYKVRILDSLTEQIHGSHPDLRWIEENKIELIRGSVANRQDCKRALQDVDVAAHLASETGTGQSMYELTRYMETNVLGTATLLEECRTQGVKRFVLASSRAVYGEGAWECTRCGRVYPQTRSMNGTTPESWNPRCPRCGKHTSRLLPTREDDPVAPTSIYGMSKQVQEQLILMTASAIGLGYGILRFFNVFGPGQSLKNPYTGVLTVFINRARLNKVLDLYEDGDILRDFIYVDDVARAIHLAIDSSEFGIYNIGSGSTLSIQRLAELIIAAIGSSSKTEVTGKMRLGDVRGLVADNTRARRLLRWQPKIDHESGIEKFVQWALQSEFEDRYEQSLKELEQHRLYG